MARDRQLLGVPSLIILLAQVLCVTAICYMENQNHANQSLYYTPCNQNTPFSMCLRTGSYNAALAPPDARCLPNGLALYLGDGTQYWREGCTDPTWTSEYCLKAFNACPYDQNGNVQVTPCSGNDNSTTWCCGGGNAACCGQAAAITIAATLGPASTASAAPTTSSSTSSSASPTSTSNGTALSDGAKAGIGVGVSLAGLAIAGTIIWVLLRMRGRKTGRVDDGGRQNMALQRPSVDWGGGGGKRVNIQAQRQPHELDASRLPSELPTG